MADLDSPIPVLAGTTASGKSSAALVLAARLPLEVVSADAMLVYREMDIGTAKPTLLERARVPHHLVDVVRPDEPFSVADYVRLAEEAIENILARGRMPLVVGGTGFYIRALSHGLPTTPAADAAAQAPLWQRYAEEGLAPLALELAAASPEDARRAQNNPRRVVRALEILRRTGKPPSAFGTTRPRFAYRKLALLPDAEELAPRIDARLEAMFAAGLVDEVARLINRYPSRPTATQAIAYRQVADYLAGRSSLAEAKAATRLATLRYAKRQRTWFVREPGVRLLRATAEQAFVEIASWLEAG